MKKLTAICGTRPEGVKLYPLLSLLAESDRIQAQLLYSGQHPDPARELLPLLATLPKRELAPLPTGGGLNMNFLLMFEALARALSYDKPDGVLVHGDTLTAFAGAIAAFQLGIPVLHMEAGLRTYDPAAPYPEEAYRVAIDAMASLMFAPTDTAYEALLREGRDKTRVFVTGNTVVDMVRISSELEASGRLSHTPAEKELLSFAEGGAPVCLLSLHRRENATPSAGIYRAVLRAMDRFPMLRVLCMVYPTSVGRAAERELSPREGLLCHPPLSIFAYHALLRKVDFVLTDSGGVQEEACVMHVPTLVLREKTERSEGVLTGGLRLVGTDEEAVLAAICELLTDEATLQSMKTTENPFGDGHAAEAILAQLESFFALD